MHHCHVVVKLFVVTLCCVRELLHSSQLDVSYFAAGVVSHLLADDMTRSMLSTTDVRELRDELVSASISFCVPLSAVVSHQILHAGSYFKR